MRFITSGTWDRATRTWNDSSMRFKSTLRASRSCSRCRRFLCRHSTVSITSGRCASIRVCSAYLIRLFNELRVVFVCSKWIPSIDTVLILHVRKHKSTTS